MSSRISIAREKPRTGHVYAPMAYSRRPPPDNRSRARVAVRGVEVGVTRKVAVGAMSTQSLAAGVIGAAIGGIGAFALISSGAGDAGSLPAFAALGGAVAGGLGGMWLAAHATETQDGA